MEPKNKGPWKTNRSQNSDGSEHVTRYNTQTNQRQSADISDTRIGGIGSNWTSVSNVHSTDQNVDRTTGGDDRHADNGPSQSSNIYDDN